ncbi:MAG: rRNA adenine N-6-methyltransferase family protein [Spirochaetales bacterium]|nr:rRNA adenine N-6-methyltransferase family protein [Spirochaetales bacterium]
MNDERRREREMMVAAQIEARGVRSPEVLAAMRAVPRHFFVPVSLQPDAYGDFPLPIGEGQTISQPFIVAAMVEALMLQPTHHVLEIGTGSGYQTAILALLAQEVYSIERISRLAARAASLLASLGFAVEEASAENIAAAARRLPSSDVDFHTDFSSRPGHIHLLVGDGYLGWPEHAPFDAIIMSAAPPEIPRTLYEQLAPGGRLVGPVGRFGSQILLRLIRTPEGHNLEALMDVAFVPMVRGVE